MEGPWLSLLKMGINRLSEIFGKIKLHRIRLGCNLLLEQIHGIAPRSDARSNAERLMAGYALRDPLRHAEVFTLGTHARDQTSRLSFLSREESSGESYLRGEGRGAAEVRQPPIPRTA